MRVTRFQAAKELRDDGLIGVNYGGWILWNPQIRRFCYQEGFSDREWALTWKQVLREIRAHYPRYTRLQQLRRLETAANEGRGLSCLRQIIQYLEQGQPDEARQLAIHDADKLQLHREVSRLLKTVLWPIGGAPVWWEP